MEDQTASPDQLREAFRGIAKDKVHNPFSLFLLICAKLKNPYFHTAVRD